MKICYFGNAESVHLTRLARHFAAAGHDVHLVTFHKPSDRTNGWSVHYIDSTVSRYKDVAFLLNNRRVRELASKIRPDIFHAHFVVSYGFYAAWSGFRPLVTSAWGSDVLVHPQKSLRLRLMARYACRRADCMLSESDDSTRVLTELLGVSPGKIKTFPWGVDVAHYLTPDQAEAIDRFRKSLGLSPRMRIVLSARSLAPIYDPPTILRSVRNVVRAHSNVMFVFLRGFGDIGYEEGMKLQAKAMGISANVRFVDHALTPDEMRLLFRCSEILVSVPRTDSASIALAEGMICGLIPIVSDLETNRSIIRDGENGFVVPIGDDAMLSNRLEYALSNRTECVKKFVPVNVDYVLTQRSWDSWIRRIEDVYGAVIGSA